MPNSPALTAGRLAQAPKPSAALRALQEKGLELPVSTNNLILPASNPTVNVSLKVSLLPLLPTPLNLEKAPPLEPGENWRRPSPVGSADTTVEEILDLYINLSQGSLQSEYEMAPHPDDSEDEDASDRMLHQPKAYRDTVASLLKYRFSSEKLTVPSMPSSISTSSSPHPYRPLVNVPVPPLQPTPEVPPNLYATTTSAARFSKTSIQITPVETPPPVQQTTPMPASILEYSQPLRDQHIALEVPDVRDAESWYKQPLSRVLREECEARLCDSQLSAVSHQRQLTYDALVAPTAAPKISPNMRPMKCVEEDHLCGSVAATQSEMVDSHMKPPSLDLTQSRPASHVSGESALAHRAEMSKSREHALPKSQHTGLLVSDSIDGGNKRHLTNSPSERFSATSAVKKVEKSELIEIYSPGSAFFLDSDDREGRDDIGTHMKAAFRLGKKKEKRKERENLGELKNTTRSEYPSPAQNLIFCPTPSFEDDLESYRYEYWLSHASAPHPEEAPLISPRRRDSIRERRYPTASSLGPSISSSPQSPAHDADNRPRIAGTVSSRSPLRRREPQLAVPLSDYQKYGPVIWDEKKRKQRSRTAAKASRATEKEVRKLAKARAKSGIKHHRGLNTQLNMDDASDKLSRQAPTRAVQKFFHSRPANSRAYTPIHPHPPSSSTKASLQLIDVAKFAPGSLLRSRASMTGPSSSTSKRSEASSDGRKKASYMSRLLMTSEERRKLKMKESITVVWGERLSAQMEST